MRLTAFLLLIGALHVSARSFAQRINLNEKNVPLRTVFKQLEQQSGYYFLYDPTVVNDIEKIDIRANNLPLRQALNQCLEGTGLKYEIIKQSIIISKSGEKEISNPSNFYTAPQPQYVQGTIVDESGKPLPGATVNIKGTKVTFMSNDKGMFSIEVPYNLTFPLTLVINYVGMKTQEIEVKQPNDKLKVVMEVREQNLQDMVITGMFTRDKTSFTGATATYSGDQLKAVGNRNVLESLKTLDPSFIQIVNNSRGSDPNTLPSFEIRGRTSISTTDLNDQFNSDSNQPLFILDGFESSLQAIYDLDMNRVASITILRDAASTALYGAKASNGVVVVETKRPVPGELRVSYSGDFDVDMPDLRSYNLMNASEKLQFEKLSGLYTSQPQNQWQSDLQYNSRAAAVASGVNTYWLSEPVQTGFTNRHSINLSGGNSDLMFNAGGSYGNNNGVMKGSGRQNWSGNFNVTYRKGKLNITNMLNLSGNTATASPYGDFADFAEANPYYKKRSADGSIPEYLDSLQTTMYNPLWNASLNSLNQQKIFSYNDNLQAIITLSHELRLQGGFQASKGTGTGIIFTPPENTQFIGVDIHQKGSYNYTHSENKSYSGNIMLTWAKVIGKNQLTTNVRADVQSSDNTGVGFLAVGFPDGTDGNPAFAYQFAPATRPVTSIGKSHSVGFLGSINYTYDQRFLLDATYRLDGSSVFGSNKQFKPFASGGLGWVISREPFMKRMKWIDLLKIRGNIGVTGNENLGQFTSISTYAFQGAQNNFGQGLDLTSLGNPNLDWQKTVQQSYGIDFGFLHGRISGNVEYYFKHTDPLAIGANGTLPSSTGLGANYVINVGNLNVRGWDFNLHVSPIYNLRQRVIWTLGVTGSANKSVYGGLGQTLAVLNQQAQENNVLARYNDGYSPDDMWAVVSRGIDPATGNEIFQKKDGTLTFTYDPDDIVNVGNDRPKIEGVVSSTFTYKDFTLGMNVRYSLGGYVQNTALYNKVENISLQDVYYNQDKRALYDRWQKPGDISQFKAISNTSYTPMSSRFIEKNNYFDGESFSLSYRLQRGWVRKMHMQSLGFTAYLNDIFYLESVKTERGIDYPYARTVSFSVSASF
ncbi:hypothetical protein A9P82_04790 [Arachidicoccus ginsenosidimutans]|nr:hypothetical protein A9P82_04790 [Arachidicoccus sp. BS20]